MKKHQLLAIVLSALVLTACNQQPSDPADSAAAPEDAATGPLVAASSADECPVAGENGHVAIAEGLTATILRNGYGQVAVLGDNVVVKATLWVHDEAAEGGKGTLVWDSGPDGFGFQLGDTRMIEGWSPGVACMLLGERRELFIAANLAYGESGRDPIPSNADIIYDLELISVAESAE